MILYFVILFLSLKNKNIVYYNIKVKKFMLSIPIYLIKKIV